MQNGTISILGFESLRLLTVLSILSLLLLISIRLDSISASLLQIENPSPLDAPVINE